MAANTASADLSSFYDHAPVGSVTLSHEGMILTTNLTVATLLGAARNELPGQLFSQFILAEDQNIFRRHHQRLFETGLAQVYELRLLRKDGELAWARLEAAAGPEAEGSPACRLTIQDITEHKRVEEDLGFFKTLLNEMGAIAKVGAWRFDAVTGEGFWTDEVARIHDVDPSLPISRDIGIHYYTDESRPIIAAAVKEAVERGVPYDLELEILSAKGVRKWVRTIGHPVMEGGRVVRVIGSLQDITDRKRSEAELRRSVERLELAMEAAQMGTWDRDLVSGALEWSVRQEALFGYAPGTFPGTVEAFTSRVNPDDQAEIWRASAQAQHGHGAFGCEYRVTWPDGAVRWLAARGRCAYDANGRPARMIGVTFDVTERKQAEEARRETEAMLEDVGRIAQIGGWEMDLTTRTARWTRTTYDLVGFSPGDPVPGPDEHVQYYVEEDRPKVIEAMRALIEENVPLDFEARAEIPGKRLRWFRVLGRAVREQGRCVLVRGTLQDITDRKRLEQERASTLVKYRTLFDSFPLGITVADRQGTIIEANRVAEGLLGISAQEQVQREINGTQWNIVRPDGTPMPADEFASTRALREQRVVENVEMGVIKPSGVVSWINVTAAPIPLPDVGVVITYGDISARKEAEAALRESEERLRLFVEHAPAALAMFDQEMRYLAASRRWMSDYGLHDKEIIGRSHYEIFPEISEAWKQFHRQGLAGEVVLMDEDRFVRADGSIQYLRWELRPWRNSRGGVGGIVIFTEDITERKLAETALRESESRFRSLIEGAPEAIFVQTDGVFQYVNRAMMRLVGASRAEDLLGQPVLDRVAPEFHDLVRERIRDGTERRTVSSPAEQEYVSLDGSRVAVETTAVAVRFRGQDAHLVFVRDISARRKSEAERASLEAQLRQAQKMESVGRLAGGVAHDFNNLLTGIMGHADLCLKKLGKENPACVHLNAIMDAAQRSAAITRQLLAFARKQAIAPVVLDLNDHIAGTLKLLRRLIGEDIELAWLPGARDGLVRMDPSQVDQILANLAVNARDAITGVGKLTVETANAVLDAGYCADHAEAVPGAYVMLSVSDTGCGMSREIQAHIFEPFFTTKPTGQGTGLGLATVYGIVKQNQGHINVYSEPGQGTTFRIYLRPHAKGEGEQVALEVPSAQPGGTETVMLVEDEEGIRMTTAPFLQDLGYTVLIAADPEDALRRAAEHLGVIHLLITDVIMPHMSGRDLAVKMLERYPDMKCLYISGYTADVIAHQGVLDKGVHFLAKPFTRDDIARKVREVMESQ